MKGVAAAVMCSAVVGVVVAIWAYAFCFAWIE